MEKMTIIDRIEIEPMTGNVGVRMKKIVLDDDGSVLSEQYHRAMIGPETDVDAYMRVVGEHLLQMKYPDVHAPHRAVLDDALLAPAITQIRQAKAAEAIQKRAAEEAQRIVAEAARAGGGS